MGDWSNGLYDNDFALDIKDDYEEGLAKGIDDVTLTQNLIDQYSNDDDIYYQMMFWVILADVQWKYGKLSDRVKNEALHYLDDEELLDNCLIEVESLKDIRKKVLLDVRERLVSGTFGKKKVKQPRLYRCEWNIGDVFEYQLHTDDSGKYRGYYIYFIMYKLQEWHPGHICPLVFVFSDIYSEKQSISVLSDIDICPQYYKPPRIYKKDLRLQYRLLILSTSSRAIPKKYIRKIGNMNIPKLKTIEQTDAMGKTYYPIKWQEIERYFVDNWIAWSGKFSKGKFQVNRIGEFDGRIPQNEDNIRYSYYAKGLYKDNIRNTVYDRVSDSASNNESRLIIYPYISHFFIVSYFVELMKIENDYYSRYYFSQCKCNELLPMCENAEIVIPESKRGCVFVDYKALKNNASVFYCDYSEKFVCKSYYDNGNNILAVGNPKGAGQCIEFADGQYAVINGTKLVAVFVNLKNVDMK